MGLLRIKYFLITGLFLFPGLLTIGQDLMVEMDDAHDTLQTENYFTNLNNQFILRFYTLFKANNVNVSKSDNTLRYRPNGTFSIGVGFNYKFLGLGFSYGIPTTKSSNENKGKTQRIDLQLSLVSKAFGGEAFLQAYRGYYISNPGDFMEWNVEKFPQLPDMQVVTLGINAFYLVNNKKYSYRAAFVGNQVQNKSAGSISAGLFGTFDQVRTDNGFIPPDLRDSVSEDFDLKSFEALTIGVSAGYMYTFVLKKGVFISLAAVPGLGYRGYKVVSIYGEEKTDNKLAFHLLGRIAIGYIRSRYFLNFNTLFNVRNYNYDSYEISLSTEQLRLTFGIRFETKASKNRGQHIPKK
jgi:hypothetical protein